MAERWLAQRADGWPNAVTVGSQLEAVYLRLGYVEVAAPGSAETDVGMDDLMGDQHGVEIGPGESFDEPPVSTPDGE